MRRALLGTLALAAVLAAMISLLIVGWNPADDDFYVRLLGVVAILDVLGTVVVPALVKFGSGNLDASRAEVRLPADLAESVADLAATSGRSSDDVVADADWRYLQQG